MINLKRAKPQPSSPFASRSDKKEGFHALAPQTAGNTEQLYIGWFWVTQALCTQNQLAQEYLVPFSAAIKAPPCRLVPVKLGGRLE